MNRPEWKKRISRMILHIRRISAVIERDRVMVYAAQASYFVLISAAPFVMLFFLVLGLVLPMSPQQITDIVTAVLPEQMQEFGIQFLSEIFNRGNVPLLSVTTIFILWSASKGIRSIGNGIQNIYDENRGRGYIRNTVNSLLYTLAFIATITLSMVVLVFGSSIQKLLTEKFDPRFEPILRLLDLKNIIFFVMLTFLFMLSYHGLAKSAISINGQFFGAAVAAAGWLVFSWGFSIYIKYFSNYPILYGGLAALVLFLLWLYMCMVILLLGAELNKWRYESKKRRAALLDGEQKRLYREDNG